MLFESVHSLAQYVPRLRRTLAALVATSAIAGISEAAVLVATVRVALEIAGDGTQPTSVPLIGDTVAPGTLIALALVFAAISLLMHLVEAVITARLVSSVIDNARRRAIHLFMTARWEHQSQEREGSLQETSTVLAGRAAILMLTVAQVSTAVVNLAALILVALIVDAVATVVVVGFGTALFVALRPVARLTQQRAREWVTSNSRYAEEVTSISRLALEFRVFGQQDTAQRILAEHNAKAVYANRKMRVASSFGSSLYRDTALLLLIGAVAALYFFVDAALAKVGTVALLVLRSIGAAQRLQSTLQASREQSPGLVSLEERLRSLELAAEPTPEQPLDSIGPVVLENVSYTYPNSSRGVHGIDLVLHPGETVGLIGPSGGGKTTLGQLLLRLRTPTTGRITVGSVDYRTVSPDDWARLTSLVPQEPQLLEASIAENIRFFRNEYSMDQIRAAATAAHITKDIENLPEKFDTVIGPRGGGLSGGQKQRIAIARALLGEPGLLVLDEPTSALDVRSERLLSDTISSLHGRTTLLIIAHRLSTLEACDRVAVLNGGRIDQIGSTSDILLQPDLFQHFTDDWTSGPEESLRDTHESRSQSAGSGFG